MSKLIDDLSFTGFLVLAGGISIDASSDKLVRSAVVQRGYGKGKRNDFINQGAKQSAERIEAKLLEIKREEERIHDEKMKKLGHKMGTFVILKTQFLTE